MLLCEEAMFSGHKEIEQKQKYAILDSFVKY